MIIPPSFARYGAACCLAVLAASLPAMPTITQQPVGSVASAGSDVVLTVAATGEAVRYQWWRDGAQLPGETNPSLHLDDVGREAEGAYAVTVMEGGVILRSAPAVLTVADAAALVWTDGFADGQLGLPWVDMATVPPAQDCTSFAETAGRLDFVALNPAGASERYLVHGATLPLDREWSLTATIGLAASGGFPGGAAGQPGVAAGFVLGVANPADPRDSLDCGFRVDKRDEAIVREVFSNHDRDGTRRDYGIAIADTRRSLVVRLSYSPDTHLLTTAYLEDSGFIRVATVAPLQAWGLSPGDSVRFALRGFAKRVNVPAGLVWADDFQLVARGGPTIVSSPAARVGTRGASSTFSVQASGEGALAFQWYRDDRVIAGATAATLTLGSLRPADLGRYHVAVTDGHGTTSSAIAALSHGDPLVAILVGPTSVAAASGQPATFSVAAIGEALQYQWRRSGVAIPGATSADLTLPAVTMADAGFYDVEVSSGLSALISASAKLEVAPAQLASTYRLDTSFSSPFCETNGATLNALGRDASGRLYAAGDLSYVGGQVRSGLARFTAALELDASYAPQVDGTVFALVVQGDGKVVIGGSFTAVNGTARTGLARLNADGTLDTSFTPPVTGTVGCLAFDGEGRLLVGGSMMVPAASWPSLVRLQSTGALDPTFQPTRVFQAVVSCFAVQPDGKIVVGAGWSWSGSGVHLTRLLEDGSIDPEFNGVPDMGTGGSVSGVVVCGDRIIVGGYLGSLPLPMGYGVFAMKKDGSLDPAFDVSAVLAAGTYVTGLDKVSESRVAVRGYFSSPSGRNFCVLTDTGAAVGDLQLGADGGSFSVVNSVLPTTDGGLVIGGALPVAGGTASLLRYDATGARVAHVSGFRSPTTSVTTVLPAAGGKWYVSGRFDYVAGVPVPGVVRLLADGSRDSTFMPVAPVGAGVGAAIAADASGRVYSVVGFGSESRLVGYDSDGSLVLNSAVGRNVTPSGLAVSPEGKIVVALANTGSPTEMGGFGMRRLARFHPDGSADLGFDVGRGPDQQINSLAVGSDGHVMIGGAFTIFGKAPQQALARLLADGSLDATFGAPLEASHVAALHEFIDGSVVVAGSLGLINGTGVYSPARLTAAGALAAANPDYRGWSGAFKALPDGRIVAAGSYYDSQSRLHPVVCFKSDATFDESFNAYDLTGYNSGLGAVSDDGRILVIGATAVRQGVSRSGLVMLKPGESPAAAITVQPVSQVATAGQSLYFSVTATGDDLTYQWFKDGVAIAGATGSTLAIPSVGVPDLGRYTVTVSNQWESVTSTAAVLSGRGTPPTFTAQPSTVVATSGMSATFTVAAAGSGPLSYQWRRFGAPIAGATGASYTIPAVESADAGFYDVVVYNGLEPLSSTAARLFVQPAVTADSYRLDTTFGPRFEMNYGSVEAIAATPDGGAYVAGRFSMIAGVRRATLVRFTSALAVDPVFAPEVDGIVRGLLLQADGRIVIGGEFQTVNGVARNGLARLNADGSLDPTFDPNAAWSGSVYQMKALPDGRIVLVGNFWTYGGAYVYAQVRRIHADGSRDSTCEVATNGSVQAFEVAPDGAILLGGSFTSIGEVSCNRLARILANGTVDPTFGVGAGPDNSVQSIVRQPDGKIVVGGWFTHFAGSGCDRIVRLNSDGSIDPAFSTGPGFDQGVMALALLPGGDIGVCGYFNSFDGVPARGVMRLNSDGTMDASFVPGARPEGGTTALALAADGNLLVGGYFTSVGGVPASGFAKYAADGTLLSTSADGYRSAGSVAAVVPLPGGKWLVGGYFNLVSDSTRYCLAQLNADGSLDPTFDAGYSVPNTVYGLARQGDGRVLVAAWDTARGHVWRLNADGSIDGTFSVGTGFDQPPNRLAILPDGRIAAAGYFTTFNGSPCGGMVVLDPTGAKDPSYATGAGFSGSVYALTVQADGRLVVGGYLTGYNGTATGNIVRIDTDGSLQAAFGPVVGPDSSVHTLSVAPDGDVVLGGYFYNVGGTAHPRRARLNPDFTVDQGYAADPAISISVDTLALLPDGRAWVNAQSDRPNRARLQLLDRLTAAGSVDAGFQSFDLVKAPTAIHPVDDGRILLVGASGTRGGFSRSGLLMLKPEASPLPQILVPPGNRQVAAGDSVTLAVSAAGESPLSYVWRKNGVELPGATAATLTIDPVNQTDAASYAIEVRNAHGSAHAIGVLVVVSGPVITTQPSDTVIPLGQSTSLVVEATGTSTPGFQWYRGERGDTANPIVGAIAPILPLNNPGAWGRYWVRVTLGGVSIDSRTALVQVTGGAVTLADWTLLPGTPAGERGALDMPADDGVSNLMKFVLGVAPTASAEARLPRAVIVAGQGSDRHLALEFVYNPAATGYNLALETSADLRTWTVVPASLENVRAEGSGQRVLLRESAPLGTAARRFARLSVGPAP